MTNIRQRADKLAAQTMDHIDLWGDTREEIEQIIAEEFERELLRGEHFFRRANTLLLSLQEDYVEMGFPIQAAKLAQFLESGK